MDGLHPKILEKVFRKETVHNTLDGWIDAVSKFNGQWRRAKVIAGKAQNKPKKKPTPPNLKEASTLDINQLSIQERADHWRKGLCFICHQQGHSSSDHKDGKAPIPKQKEKDKSSPTDFDIMHKSNHL
jgi:hypothetical protein